MAYRKIEVDGKSYEYTIGRTHVKVKGVGVATLDEVGRQIDVENYCDADSWTTNTAVQPADVARFIRIMVTKDQA